MKKNGVRQEDAPSVPTAAEATAARVSGSGSVAEIASSEWLPWIERASTRFQRERDVMSTTNAPLSNLARELLSIARKGHPVWRDELRVCDRKACEELIAAGLARWSEEEASVRLRPTEQPTP